MPKPRGYTEQVRAQREIRENAEAWALWFLNDLAAARIALDNAEAHGAQGQALEVAKAFIGSAERRMREEVRVYW